MKSYIFYACFAAACLISASCAMFVPIAATTTAGMLAMDERSSGIVVDDAMIVAKIKAEYSKNNASNLLAKISVNAYEGRVMLTGTLKTQEYVDEAVRRAWLVHGVREVIDELSIAEVPKSKATDMWISGQIKAKFLIEKHFDSLNYQYDVNDSVVYLLGVAQNEDEMQRAIEMCANIKNVSKVVSHVILRVDKRRQKSL